MNVFVVLDKSERVRAWMSNATTEWNFHDGGYYIGMANDEGELVAGVMTDNFTGSCMDCHIVATPGQYLRPLLRGVYWFAFELKKCKRLTFFVWDSNEPAVKLVTALGAVREAVLREAHPTGDVLVFSLWADAARRWR